MMDAVDIALGLLSKAPDPLSLLLRDTAYVIPLQWLYTELIRNKDLIPLSNLETDRKVSIWNQVIQLEKPQYVKIWTAQVIYLLEEDVSWES